MYGDGLVTTTKEMSVAAVLENERNKCQDPGTERWGEGRTSIPPARVDSHKARSATRAAEVSFMIYEQGNKRGEKRVTWIRVRGLGIRLGID